MNFPLSLPTNPGQFQGKQATSLAIPGRRIGRTNGPDRAFFCHFAKKSSNLREINPRSKFLSQEILQKKPSAFLKINSQSNSAGWRKFANKTLSSHKINPTSISSLSFFFKKNPSDFNWIKPQPVSSITSTRATLYLQFKHQNVLESKVAQHKI